MRVGFIVLVMLISGCTFGAKVQLPPPPMLPEIAYVQPCDPKAVAGLTNEAVEALRNRDILLRRHIQTLEQQIRGPQ
ncbi:MAG: hypothetical protein EXR78_08915 [Deltaproteobacteria bacterium]|nr:hypothetical protein [Deltaproteobacteria bacterium]